MSKRMTNPEFDKTLNGIAIDSILLVVITLIGLVIFGTVHEHGDQNAGGMYGFYIIPVIPIILISLGLIAASKFYLNPSKTWLNSLVPIVLMLFGIWLNPTDVKILITVLLIIISYSILKTAIKSISI